MRSILLTHAKRYPLMEPTDAVKLIYQNEFGGGHLIRDQEACLEFLRREYEALCQRRDIPLLEDIGNGLVRVNLCAVNTAGFTIDELGQAFLQSAARCQGTEASFRCKLALLTELTDGGKMPFSSDCLHSYLTVYEAQGFPAVSHSEIYRKAYRPAYRVVARACLPNQVL